MEKCEAVPAPALGSQQIVASNYADRAQGADSSVHNAGLSNLWDLVAADSCNFSYWTCLIEEIDRTYPNDILKIRQAYDAFLKEFPLCVGYWIRYACHESFVDSDKVQEIYLRAVEAAGYSIDLWVHYCQYAISTSALPTMIRSIFEIGLQYVGSHYNSNSLWDEYVKFEEAMGDLSKLAVIYTRILENPVQDIDKYFAAFNELVETHNLTVILTDDEASMYYQTDGQLSLTHKESQRKYVAEREVKYNKAKNYESKIINFEQAIKRPYFHVLPLDKEELGNWHNYLDFMEGQDIKKVFDLYQRCLIACANYPEFWIRFVRYMENKHLLEQANDALHRATNIFVKNHTEIHLFSARFKELNGDVVGACSVYKHVYSNVSPGLLEAIVLHANLERRQGNINSACSVYEKAIGIEKGKEQSYLLQSLIVQYARFLQMEPDMEKARETLSGLYELENIKRVALEDAILLESNFPSTKPIELLDSLVEKFLSESTQEETTTAIDKEEISRIFLKFLDRFGDPQSIKKAIARHENLLSRERTKSTKVGNVAQSNLRTDQNAPSPVTFEASVQQQGPSYEAQNTALHGATVMFSDFMIPPENALVEEYKFKACSILGSVPEGQSACPCTPTGTMVLNSFLGHAEHFYSLGLCWAGEFSMSDMIILDGVLCKIRTIPQAVLTLDNFKLDVEKWKSNLLEKFKTKVTRGKARVLAYPPYFRDLMFLLDHPPTSFDSDEAVRKIYLDDIFGHVALATPPARMMSLINFCQFVKTLKGMDVAIYEVVFDKIMSAGWVSYFGTDKLFKLVANHGKTTATLDDKTVVLSKMPAVKYASLLRHTFVHLVEYTSVEMENRPLLENFIECDLLIAHQDANFLPRLLKLIRKHKDTHPLLQALWEFYIYTRRSYQPRLKSS